MFGGFGSELPPNRISALQVGAAEREAMFGQRWQVGGFAFLGSFNDLLTNLESIALAASFVRERIRETVADAATARALCPSHPIGCKRLCVDTGYYAAFNRPNVRLVDLNAAPLEGFTHDTLVAGGERHRIDAVVLATGFDAVTGTLLKLDLRGRDGVPIRQKWAGGPLNYLGLGIAGFPNLFHLVGPGSTAAFTNVIVAIEHHVDWVADCIAWLDAHGRATIEPTPAAEAAWGAHVDACARGTVFLGCNSWYLGANIPGKPRMFMPLASSFPGYVKRCAEVAETGYTGFALG
jgi:cyclohexanone monooxygenase